MAAEARGPSLQSIAEATTAWSSAFNRSIKERYALLQRSLEVTGATLSALPKVDYMSLRNAILLIEQHNALLPPWTPQVLKTLSEKHRNQVIEDGCHYMQLSEAAYGWRGALAMGMLGGTDSGASALSGVLGSVMSGDKAAFAHRAGVQVDSILYRSVDSELQEPHHWLVVDHERRELDPHHTPPYTACRGTINVDDAVMDLTATAVPFLRGQAHEGMAAAAHKLHASCFSGDRLNLPGRLESLPGYGLVLTGHSLGGSVAVLLTMLLLHHRHEMEAALPPRHHAHVPLHGVPIRCVAFGMAPVYSSRSPLPPGTHQAITAFVNGDDIVSRLSVRSFNRYMRLAGAVAAAAPTLAESISASMMMKETRSPAEVIQAGLRSATQHPDVEDEPELHIPGHI
ncbi:Dagla, partial [Symbiodinium sp. KB8]